LLETLLLINTKEEAQENTETLQKGNLSFRSK